MRDGAAPRLLFATCRPPFPLDNGARIRTHRLLTGLARSFDTQLVTFEFPPGHPDGHVSREQLEQLLPGVAVATVPGAATSKRVSQLASLAQRGSWTLGRYSSDAFNAALTAAVERQDPHVIHFDDPGVALAPTFAGPLNVYSSHNIEQTLLEFAARVGSAPRRAFNALEGRKVAREEPEIWRRMDLCLAVSDLDRAVMAAGGARRVELCPNGVDPVERLPLRRRRDGDPLRLLFVGSGNYAPYERGIAWLVREVLPRLRAAGAHVSFDVVGAPPAAPVAAEGVRYLGRVAEVAPHYDAADVVVVPVFEGSGTRLKVIEAAAYGRPVVSTRLGAEGLGLEADRHYLAAEDSETFANAVLELERWSQDPADDRLEQMVAAAHEAIAPITWPRVVESLSELYRSEIERRNIETTSAQGTHAPSLAPRVEAGR